jgi:hypothetical protein
VSAEEKQRIRPGFIKRRFTMSITGSRHISINIAARLEVGGHVLRVGQVSGNSIVLEDRIQLLEPTSAELVVTVRGREKRYSLFFPHGIDSSSEDNSFW